ncbi:DUF4199 domain-containing protein [Mucilaginibacter aquaedulcis]|jgi:hypothetical protein|uniref:DUF4199 domain-containing protein n=1 Tax=Mucilaginibacter aquaedulcis TaxID=1187081 RepID=UPI0025B30B63|nr:DUF4199 domain-containing protein [Mucilaginibacter aquaedulcis]MDN3546804.1 DUF4199 domain-containing protein [Mucilaginibacter aquaedulcis]
MESKKVTPISLAIKWGLIYVVTSIVITYIIQFLNLDPDSPVKWLGMVPFIAFMFLTQKELRDNNGGYITFGEAFKVGFLYSILSGIVLVVFTYLYFAVLSPEMLEKILASTEAKLAAKGLSQEQIDQGMTFTRKFVGPKSIAIGALVSSIIMGVIVSLIGAAIFKKERSPFDVVSTSDQTSEPTV